jgi:hypothetical protein
MKIRAGFVSNSSSSAFLLDLNDPQVRMYFEEVLSSGIGRIQYPTRCTGYSRGDHLTNLINEVLRDNYMQYGFLDLVLEAAVMDTSPLILMESDEEMGGVLPDGFPTEKILRECEYH